MAEGQIEILGNILGSEDLRLFYQFTGEGAEQLSEKYVTQAEKDVIILVKAIS